jgi:small-conductance mechanosensitive channel
VPAIFATESRGRLIRLAAAALGVLLLSAPVRGQAPGPPADGLTTAVVAAAVPSAHPATLHYANRVIVEFHAEVMARTPEERAAAAVQFLDRLVDETPGARVTTRAVAGAAIVNVGDHGVFAIFPADVNPLAGETVEGAAAVAAMRLQRAFDETIELRSPARLLRGAALAIEASLLYLVLLWLLRRIHRLGARQIDRTTERTLEKMNRGADLVRVSRVPELLQRGVSLVTILLALMVTYSWATFVLRRFPYTRPWGESLRTALVAAAEAVGRRVLDSLPDLLTVLVIVVATRFAVKLSHRLFDAVEDQRIVIPGLYPETAPPTRRIATALLWLLAIVVAYPYLPGSNSEAFKGVSVFVGLMISLGSSGVMNQVMSGLTITYSRALRVGDFVKIGDVEGTVEHLGVLSTKVKTDRHEEITIPNTLVVSASTTNYSWYAAREGVRMSTSVTIGYDTPWRQVEAMLLLAAGRTAGVRREPAPVVRQTGLLDYYVQYTLLVCLEQPALRVTTFDALHANILDVFNEYGVQITSPNYVADPSGQKVVPPSLWYAAPAAPPGAPPIQEQTVADHAARTR